MSLNENLLSGELQIDSIAHTHLKETAMWGKFLSIVGFVATALIVFMALFAGSKLATISSYSGAGMTSGVIMFVYLIVAALSFIVSLYLYKFSIKLKTALLNNDQEDLNSSFQNLKLIFRIYGIIVIIYLGLIALGLIFGIAMTAMS